MRTSRRPATPDYESDVITNGVICLYRNEAGRRFSSEDQFILSEEWIDPEDLPDTYTRLEAAEHRLASKHSLAWHPDFGYLSPIPEHCGTGLQIYAEFHLEGLHLIGDLPPVLAGLEAMRLAASGIDADGMRNAGHLFRINNIATLGISERKLVRRIMAAFCDLAKQETYARKTLLDENPRILEDAVARALAILKSARLLAPLELFDLLSPILLAANMNRLSGISSRDVRSLMIAQIKKPLLPPPETIADERRRDNRDAALADRVNRHFASVSLEF